MPAEASRQSIGDLVLSGRGYELGAGLTPSRFAKVADLVFIDKRDHAELTVLFGASPAYPVVRLEDAKQRLDFVTAHHVLEHCPDPIGALRKWLGLVRHGGNLFLSLPSSRNSCEHLREVTPTEHLLRDHLFRVDGRDFESRNHIPSFLSQWVVARPDLMDCAQRGVGYLAQHLLYEQRRIEGHDLHWHTYCPETFGACIEVAAYLGGLTIADLVIQESADELFATGTVCRRRSRKPLALAEFERDLRRRLKHLRH